MEIEFDPEKRDLTLQERGLDFAQVGALFASRHMTILDDRRDYGEERHITFGMIDDRIVVVVWTERNGKRRVISLRKANEREQRIFHKALD